MMPCPNKLHKSMIASHKNGKWDWKECFFVDCLICFNITNFVVVLLRKGLPSLSAPIPITLSLDIDNILFVRCWKAHSFPCCILSQQAYFELDSWWNVILKNQLDRPMESILPMITTQNYVTPFWMFICCCYQLKSNNDAWQDSASEEEPRQGLLLIRSGQARPVQHVSWLEPIDDHRLVHDESVCSQLE